MVTKNKMEKKKIGQKILLVLCTMVFAVSTSKLISLWIQYKQASDDFNKLRNEIMTDPNTDKKQESGKESELPDYKKLAEQNPDLIGWIYLPNENSYPVMHTPDRPQYYLRRNFEKEYSIAGCIFLADENQTTDNHQLLYGHHMKDKSMFGGLENYMQDEDYFKEHREIRFDSLDNVRNYRVFAAFKTSIYGESDGFNIYKNVKDLNEEEYNMFVAEVKEHSIYKVDETPGYGTPLLTLSTCSYHRNDGAGREVVVCYLEKEFDKNGNLVEIKK